MPSDFSKVGEDARWVAAMNFVAVGLKFLTIPILARFIGAEEFGAVAVAIAVFQLMSMMSVHSVNTALVAAEEHSPELWHTAFLITLGLGLLVSMTLVLFAPQISQLLGAPSSRVFIQTIGLIAPLTFVAEFFVSLMSKNLTFRKQVVPTIVSNLASGFSAILLVFLGFGVWALMAQHIVFSIVRVIAMSVVTPFRPRIYFNWPLIKPVLPEAARSLTAMIGHYLSNQGVVLIVTRVLDAAAGGIFFVCNRFTVLPMEVLGSSLGRVIFPNFSKLSREGGDRKELLRWALSVSSTILSPIYFGMWAVAVPITDVLLGARWSEISSIFAIMAIAGALKGPQGVFSSYFQGTNRFDLLVKVNFLNALLILAFVTMGAFLNGLTGACVGILASRFITVLLTGIVVFRIEAMDSVSGFYSFIPSMIVAFIMSVVVLLFISQGGVSALHSAVQLGLGGMLGCAIYVGCLRIFLPQALREVIQVLKPASARQL